MKTTNKDGYEFVLCVVLMVWIEGWSYFLSLCCLCVCVLCCLLLSVNAVPLSSAIPST